MMYHCDGDVVKEVGANAAIIYQNIKYWCEKNAANKRHCHEGLYWTYNSMEAFCELFDCFTFSQIKTALNKLEDKGFIKSGNYNKSGYDRTKWYADQKSPLHLSKIANGTAINHQPIPDSKPDYKKPTKKDDDIDEEDLFNDLPPSKQPDPDQELIDNGFEEWWNNIWPSHQRKTQKKDCRDLYFKTVRGKFAKADQISAAKLNAATRAYIASVKDPQYLKGPLPWLRQPGWEPFVGQGGPDGGLTNEQIRLRKIIAANGGG